LAVVFSVSMFSCGTSYKAANTNDSVVVETVEVVEVADSCCKDSVCNDSCCKDSVCAKAACDTVACKK
ncbi:MAG: hypothetical protein IJZ17_01270, partial [Muribaculaceae bacterium]|nr:hypothetical protein [Muribaculaceae bacterium]